MNIELAKQEFEKYLSQYDINDFRTREKIVHTYNVVKTSKYLSEKLGLDKEQTDLAQMIGLLHDIGRFEQLKEYGSFEDYKTMDHAIFGAKILFEEGLIRKFVKEYSYDDIIYAAILNHNKIEIEKAGMNELTLLHSKVIRDSDKIDNFRLQSEIIPEKLLNTSLITLQNEELTSPTYDSLKKGKMVIFSKRKTNIDKWVSLLGLIYDFNFKESLEYIKENEYIKKAMERIEYKNEETARRVEEVTAVANSFLEKQIDKKNIGYSSKDEQPTL